MKSCDGSAKWYLTPAGTYKVRFYDTDGKEHNRNCETKTERDALMRAIKKQEQLDYWFPPEESSVERQDVGTFKGLSDLWIEHSAKVREISKSCLGNYLCHLNHHVLPVFGESRLENLSLKDVEHLAKVLKDKKPQTRSYVAVRRNRMEEEFFHDDDFLSPAYRREILTVACMVTKFGFERGYLVANPFREFKLPECPEQPYDYWRLEEEDKFLQWLEGGGLVEKMVCRPHSKRLGKPEMFLKRFRTRNTEELYDIVLFALRSGMRKGEIGALTARDVNFEKNCIVVRRAYSEKEKKVRNTTKGKTFRLIEMNEDMRNILRKLMTKVKTDTDLLFSTTTWAIKNFSKYCAKAGVRQIHFHSLRHTCLTNLANGYGMDKPLPLPQVQKIAGHKDISTTMRYVHSNGIEQTTSMQWSRERRKAFLESPVQTDPSSTNSNVVGISESLKSTQKVEDAKPLIIPLRVISGGRA
jgi:integrase